jgi:hypothetical protein
MSAITLDGQRTAAPWTDAAMLTTPSNGAA